MSLKHLPIQSSRLPGVVLPLLLILYCSEGAMSTPSTDAFEQAQKLVAEHRYAEAIQSFDQALKLNPKYAEAYAYRGRAKLLHEEKSTAKYQQALVDCSKAIALNPKLAIAYAIRGAVYSHLDQADRAAQDCNKALSIDPKLPRAYTNRAWTFATKGRTDLAIADYNRAIELDSKEQLAYRGRAQCYLQINQPGKALADVNMAQKLDPQDEVTYLLRSMVARSISGDPSDGLPDINKAIKLNPRFYHGYTLRAGVYGALKLYQKAVSDCDQALALIPKGPDYAKERSEVTQARAKFVNLLSNQRR